MNDGMFNSCLTGIESGDKNACLSSLRLMAQHPDIRSLEVLKTLTSDNDPVINSLAQNVYESLTSQGLKSAVLKKDDPVKEIVYLFTAQDVVDETGFIYKKVFPETVLTSFKYSLLKIICGMTILYFYSDFLLSSPQDYSHSMFRSSFIPENILPIMLAVLFYQLFFRPLAWFKIAGNLLQGFKDRQLVTQGRRKLTAEIYGSLCRINIPRVIIQYCLVFALVYIPFIADSLVITLVLIFMGIGISLVTLPMFPLTVMARTSTSETFSTCLRMFNFSILKKLNLVLPPFLLFVGILYLSFTGGLMSLLVFFSVISMFEVNSIIVVFASAMIVDFMIDPFCIVFQLLITKYILLEEAAKR